MNIYFILVQIYVINKSAILVIICFLIDPRAVRSSNYRSHPLLTYILGWCLGGQERLTYTKVVND